ncbi:MAG: transporter [Nitrospirae bacterium]|nr:MAG: transporter [Nitrospirota bacterium]
MLGGEEGPTWQVSSSVNYNSGDYGTDTTTTSLYIPLTVKRLFEDGSISLTIPYISIESDGSVTFIGGEPHGQKRRQRGKGSGVSGGDRDKDGDGDVDDDDQIPGIRAARTTESGLGDIILSGRYFVFDEGDWLPSVAVTGFVKFPTADEDRGLGTGEYDGGFGAQLSKFLTDDLIVYVDGGYTFIGQPPGPELNNQWNYDVGVGYYLTDDLLASAFYEEWRAVTDTGVNPWDLFFSLQYSLLEWLRVNASGLVGLSDGAPDYGVSGGLLLQF